MQEIGDHYDNQEAVLDERTFPRLDLLMGRTLMHSLKLPSA